VRATSTRDFGAGDVTLEELGPASDGAPDTRDALVDAAARDEGPAGSRVTGAQLLYLFDEGGGTTVKDHGSGAPLDLTIGTPGAVTWLPGALKVSSSVIISSATPPMKVFTPCTADDAVTLEAWVVPETLTPPTTTMPARIASYGSNINSQNVLLGQGGCSGTLEARYCGRVQLDEELRVETAANAVQPSVLTHLALVYENGTATLYFNGLAASAPKSGSGSLSAGWKPTEVFTLANENDGKRAWVGTLHLVAFYCRALTAAEVLQNHAAGADPELP